MIIKLPSLILSRRSLILGAAASLLVPRRALATNALVQHVQGAANASAGTTTSVTITAGTTGNLLCGTVGCDTGATVTSVKDQNGVSATLVDAITDSPNTTFAQSFYFANISGSPTTITATFSGSIGDRRIQCSEYSGLATSSPLDVHTGTPASTIATIITTGSVTTTVNGDLLYAAAHGDSDGGIVFAAGTGYTLRDTDNSNSIPLAQEDLLNQTLAGPTVATFSITSPGGTQAAIILLMAFKPSGGSPPVVPRRNLLGVGL